MSRESAPALLVNLFSPEMNHLAAELAIRGRLLRYVRPYANQGRRWERALERIPGLRQTYSRTFGRRVLPEGIASGNVAEAGVFSDFMLAASRLALGRRGESLEQGLQARVQRLVAGVAVRHAAGAATIVASYGVARPAFERSDARRVLNYPIAHHRYMRRFIAEEAALDPEFSSTAKDWGIPTTAEERSLDAECELADVILVGSTFARDTFIDEGIPSEKLLIVPYGADTRRFDPVIETATTPMPFRVLFVGQIGQRKGVPYLLRAYRAFQRPDTRLTLVGALFGDDKQFEPYRNLFTHVPHVPQAQLAKIYRQSDVFVFPTLIDGLGMVVLEAMASGLPVITTRNGPGDVVRDGIDGFLVPIRDADAIAEKLEYLRANPERRREMGRNARQRSLEYTWAAYRQRCVAAIDSRIGGG